MPIVKRLEGKRALILMAPGYEDSEFRGVVGSLLLEGAQIMGASITMDELMGVDDLPTILNTDRFQVLRSQKGEAICPN